MNFVVAISVTYSYILSIGLQDKIGILVNQVFKVEREIPEKQTKSKTISICEDVNVRFKFLFFLKVGIFAEKQKNNVMRDQGSSASLVPLVNASLVPLSAIFTSKFLKRN